LEAGDGRGALAAADAHLRAHPGDRPARTLRARALSECECLDEALRVYWRLVAEDPSDMDARLGYARTLHWAGRHREAARLYRQREAEGVDEADVYSGLAYAEYWAGRPDRARPALDRLLDREAANREGLALRSSLRRDWRPSVAMGYELSKDSDDLDLG